MPPRRRIAHTPARTPLKVPFGYVVELLKQIYDASPEDFTNRISKTALKQHRVDNGHMIPVSKLKPLFRHARDFNEFKQTHLTSIPSYVWIEVMNKNKRLGRYVSKYIGGSSAANKKKLKMKSFIGSPDDVSDVSSDESIFSIADSKDRCDRNNKNLPKSVCQGVRRVCRYYDDARRYKPFDKDDSEDSLYNIHLEYQ